MEQTLGKRIVSHRKRLGLTQDQLAEQLGITAQAVSKWENDLSCPDITMLPKLAQIFGTTTDALLGIEPEPVREAELVIPELETHPKRKGNWEFHWDGGRRSRVGLAVLVLLVGGLLLAGSLLEWPVTFWGLLWPCTLLVFGIWGLYPRFGFVRLGCVLFGAYFLAEELGLLTGFLGGKLVFPAVLVLLGLSLLAEALRHPAKPSFHIHHGGDHQKFSSSCRMGEESFNCETTFGGDRRTIDLPRLSRGSVDCCFGELTVDLSGVDEVASGCCINIDSAFGSVILLVPRRFRMEVDTDTAFATVEVTGRPDENAAPIRLNCDVSFGSVEVRYL